MAGAACCRTPLAQAAEVAPPVGRQAEAVLPSRYQVYHIYLMVYFPPSKVYTVRYRSGTR